MSTSLLDNQVENIPALICYVKTTGLWLRNILRTTYLLKHEGDVLKKELKEVWSGYEELTLAWNELECAKQFLTSFQT